MRVKVIATCLFFLACFSCKDPYWPEVIASSPSYLVVEGVLVPGAAPTSIRITRTGKLDGDININPEQSAVVTVEGADNTVRSLTTTGNGFYTSPGLNLVLGTEYRLRIKTSDGKEYLSEYVKAVQTPPIESIGWKLDGRDAICFVNTSDPSGNTTYYRWDYDETWEIRTYYIAKYKYMGGTNVHLRTPDEMVNVCWKYGTSSNIALGSSAQLQSDVIHEGPVVFYPEGDEKLAVRYSILLRQYALDKKGYEFYNMMKKNTESIGTIFDPQPTELTGNIRCLTNPTELVIGYITASTISEKRAFVTSAELGGWTYPELCTTQQILHPDSTILGLAGNYGIPVEAVINGNDTTHWIVAPAKCADCTWRGGSLLKPSYW